MDGSGDPTLSVRGETAIECWRIVEPVLAAWRNDQVPLEEYRPAAPDPTCGVPSVPERHGRRRPPPAHSTVRGARAAYRVRPLCWADTVAR
jgi:hypothetical protein